jgi:hypothetical protein
MAEARSAREAGTFAGYARAMVDANQGTSTAAAASRAGPPGVKRTLLDAGRGLQGTGGCRSEALSDAPPGAARNRSATRRRLLTTLRAQPAQQRLRARPCCAPVIGALPQFAIGVGLAAARLRSTLESARCAATFRGCRLRRRVASREAFQLANGNGLTQLRFCFTLEGWQCDALRPAPRTSSVHPTPAIGARSLRALE